MVLSPLGSTPSRAVPANTSILPECGTMHVQHDLVKPGPHNTGIARITVGFEFPSCRWNPIGTKLIQASLTLPHMIDIVAVSLRGINLSARHGT
jgi:hypothetical protein